MDSSASKFVSSYLVKELDKISALMKEGSIFVLKFSVIMTLVFMSILAPISPILKVHLLALILILTSLPFNLIFYFSSGSA